MKKTIIKDYGTHSYKETYIKLDDIYCVNCGDKEVWCEEGSGDYYMGVDFICTSCASIFNLPSLDNTPDKMTKKMVQQLVNNSVKWLLLIG